VHASTAPRNDWVNLGPAPVKNITYGGVSNQDASGRALAVAFIRQLKTWCWSALRKGI
jgi:hypothetical protein